MFHWLKRLFCRPRLIERYEDLDAIIEAHNALIKKTLDIMRDPSVPAKYALSRFKAIQDAEEKAIAAYWRNKDRKADKWCRRPAQSVTPPENDVKSDTMTGITQEKAAEIQPDAIAAPPTVEAVPLEQPTSAQALEQPKDTVQLEITINK